MSTLAEQARVRPAAGPRDTRVLAFTGGRNVPSARFRVEQHRAPLEAVGVHVDIAAAPFGSYPPRSKVVRPLWAAASLVSRVPGVVRSRRYDVTLLQREMLSTFHTLERFTGRPRVLDVDDAIWLLPRGEFAGRMASGCDRVIAGNAYVAEYFRRYCPDVAVLPTAVDAERFRPATRPARDSVVLGWSGSSSGHGALESIEQAIGRALDLRPGLRLRIMSDRRPPLPSLPVERVEFVRWSTETEAEVLQSFDIGLMPLADGPWERGKCSYKMLLYMACGAPVVVSPVGMNAEVLALGEVGRAAVGPQQWLDAVLELADSYALRQRLGTIARGVVEEQFSVRVLAPRLAELLRGVNG